MQEKTSLVVVDKRGFYYVLISPFVMGLNERCLLRDFTYVNKGFRSLLIFRFYNR